MNSFFHAMIDYCEKYRDLGLVDIQSICPSIKVDLRYATNNNFIGKCLYATDKAYCIPELADRVKTAQKNLHIINPDWSIIVWDAARPVSIQKIFYEQVKGTDREPYIANPYFDTQGGFHNYGMAVDVSIVDANSEPVDMGTDFDNFSELAHSGKEAQLYIEKKISLDAYNNRTLLYYIMGKGGLVPHPLEWWHFQYHQSDADKLQYRLLEF